MPAKRRKEVEDVNNTWNQQLVRACLEHNLEEVKILEAKGADLLQARESTPFSRGVALSPLYAVLLQGKFSIPVLQKRYCVAGEHEEGDAEDAGEATEEDTAGSAKNSEGYPLVSPQDVTETESALAVIEYLFSKGARLEDLVRLPAELFEKYRTAGQQDGGGDGSNAGASSTTGGKDASGAGAGSASQRASRSASRVATPGPEGDVPKPSGSGGFSSAGPTTPDQGTLLHLAVLLGDHAHLLQLLSLFGRLPPTDEGNKAPAVPLSVLREIRAEFAPPVTAASAAAAAAAAVDAAAAAAGAGGAAGTGDKSRGAAASNKGGGAGASATNKAGAKAAADAASAAENGGTHPSLLPRLTEAACCCVAEQPSAFFTQRTSAEPNAASDGAVDDSSAWESARFNFETTTTDGGVSAVDLALMVRDIPTARLLEFFGASTLTLQRRLVNASQTALARACSEGDVVRVEQLLDSGDSLSQISQDGRYTLIHYAAAHPPVLEYLIKRGLSVEYENAYGDSALCSLLRFGSGRNADYSIRETFSMSDNEKLSSLPYAAFRNYVLMPLLPLIQQQANTNASGKSKGGGPGKSKTSVSGSGRSESTSEAEAAAKVLVEKNVIGGGETGDWWSFSSLPTSEMIYNLLAAGANYQGFIPDDELHLKYVKFAEEVDPDSQYRQGLPPGMAAPGVTGGGAASAGDTTGSSAQAQQLPRKRSVQEGGGADGGKSSSARSASGGWRQRLSNGGSAGAKKAAGAGSHNARRVGSLTGLHGDRHPGGAGDSVMGEPRSPPSKHRNTARQVPGRLPLRQPPLFLAIINYFPEVIRKFVLEFKADIMRRDSQGACALHYAALCEHPSVLELMLTPSVINNNANFDINATDMAGRTPLHYAALKGNDQAVKQLLALGPSLEAGKPDLDGWTPLHLAVMGNHAGTVQLLVQSAEQGQQLLQQQGPSAGLSSAFRTTRGGSGGSAAANGVGLLGAGRRGNSGGTTRTVGSARSTNSANSASNNGLSSLSGGAGGSSVLHGSGGALASPYLIVDVDAEDNESGLTPLQIAVHHHGDPAIIKALLQGRAQSYRGSGLPSGGTLLHRAVRNNDVGTVRMLLEYFADPNDPDAEDHSPLYLALCCDPPNMEVVTALLQNGAWVHQQSSIDLDTPMHKAARSGNRELIELCFHKVKQPSLLPSSGAGGALASGAGGGNSTTNASDAGQEKRRGSLSANSSVSGKPPASSSSSLAQRMKERREKAQKKKPGTDTGRTASGMPSYELHEADSQAGGQDAAADGDGANDFLDVPADDNPKVRHIPLSYLNLRDASALGPLHLLCSHTDRATQRDALAPLLQEMLLPTAENDLGYDLEAVRVLCTARDSLGRNPLHLACGSLFPEAVLILTGCAPESAFAVDGKGMTPLHYAVMQCPSSDDDDAAAKSAVTTTPKTQDETTPAGETATVADVARILDMLRASVQSAVPSPLTGLPLARGFDVVDTASSTQWSITHQLRARHQQRQSHDPLRPHARHFANELLLIHSWREYCAVLDAQNRNALLLAAECGNRQTAALLIRSDSKHAPTHA